MHQQVEVALAVALDVGEAVEGVRQRRAVLCEQLELGHLQRRLAAARLGRMARHADHVAEVDVDLGREQLDPAASVDEVREGDLPHLPPRQHAPGQRNCCDRLVGLARLDLVRASPDTRRSRPSPGKRFGSMERKPTPLGCRGSCTSRDPPGRRDLDGLALLLADDRLADRRLVGELQLGGVGLGQADDEVLVRALGVDVAKPHLRADGDDARVDLAGLDHARVRQAVIKLSDPVLEHRLLVLGVVVLRVLGDVTELAGGADAVGNLATLAVERCSIFP